MDEKVQTIMQSKRGERRQLITKDSAISWLPKEPAVIIPWDESREFKSLSSTSKIQNEENSFLQASIKDKTFSALTGQRQQLREREGEKSSSTARAILHAVMI